MNTTGQVLAIEKKTVEAMIRIYCRGNGHAAAEGGCCSSCGELRRYAHERLDKCVFGEEKPTCAKCPVHCYQPKQKSEITALMRYAGPKMLLRHPILALHHVMAGKKELTGKAREIAERKKRQNVS